MENKEEVLEPVSRLAQSVHLRLEEMGENAPTVFRLVRKEFGLNYRTCALTPNELIGHLNSQSDYSTFDETLYAIEGLTNPETNEWEYI